MRKTIFLIGYMGCGKTTLGRALAARTGVRFIDLDDYIEERAGMTISGIFATKGESAFRAMEREALETLRGWHTMFRRQHAADGLARDNRTPRYLRGEAFQPSRSRPQPPAPHSPALRPRASRLYRAAARRAQQALLQSLGDIRLHTARRCLADRADSDKVY